jgi:signal transduction histidine kinase
MIVRAIFMDIGKTEQVLKNLSNAKFTPDSGTVNMTFSQPDLDHKYTSSTLALLKPEEIIKIQDSGIGISEENKKNYFKVFSKQIAQLVENMEVQVLDYTSLNN